MNAGDKLDWRAVCAETGLDPQEIRKVSQRYDMYADYTLKQGGTVLDLPRWYRWYREEKLADGHARLQPPPADCSVSAEADPQADASLISEARFLQLLRSYRGSS